MSETMVVHQITRQSLDIDLAKGEPPEKAIRVAISQVLYALARQVERSSWESGEDFPLIFPLRLTLQSEKLRWDLRIRGILENAIATDTRTGQQDGYHLHEEGES